jgi:UDP-N-acetylglucosamine--N-acetylmuramyl-(pentapeptide) pyrophosphoryl-undecaprenol N-acetylglucosamine transferase
VKLLIAGGGTGGHLFPGIAVAEEFLSRDSNNGVLFVGTEAGIEARILHKSGYRLRTIATEGIRGRGGFSKARSIGLLLYAYSQSRQILKEFRPGLVLGVGGYASGPVVLAARGMMIPRFIHEQNAIPGFTNKLLARVSEKVFISLEESRKFFPKERTLLTGNPLRRQILDSIAATGGNPTQPPFDEGGCPTGRGNFHLLAFGGSRGAHAVNLAMVAALPHLKVLGDRLTVTHQTGTDDLEQVREGYNSAGVHGEVIPFIDDMAAEYGKADLIVCRAGATTIAEVTATGKACIFIPFPHAVDDHQRRNAEALLKEHAGFMLLERELSGESLGRLILDLASDPERIFETARNARGLARPDAVKIIVDEMLKALK